LHLSFTTQYSQNPHNFTQPYCMADHLESVHKTLRKLLLSEEQKLARNRADYIAKVNNQEQVATRQDYKLPSHLEVHIPDGPGKYFKLSDTTRKAYRAKFNLHKTFPEQLNFQQAGIKNKKLGSAIKTFGQRIQTNSKHSLGAALEIGTDLHHTGTDFFNTLTRTKLIPKFIYQAWRSGKFQADQQGIEYICATLHHELKKYENTLEQLKSTSDKLETLAFLLGDSSSDLLEQLKTVCLAIKNLKPPADNTAPTQREFRAAQRTSYNPYTPNPFRGRGRGRGRGYRGRLRGRGARPYTGYQTPYRSNNQFNNNNQ